MKCANYAYLTAITCFCTPKDFVQTFSKMELLLDNLTMN